MNLHFLALLIVSFFLTSCRIANSGAEVGARPRNSIRTVPENEKHVKVQVKNGTVHINVPPGWHHSSTNPPVYTLTHAGTYGNLPFIRMRIETGLRGGLSEEEFHQAHLRDIHTNYFSARRSAAGSVELNDGRIVSIEEYADGDVPELAAFVSEKDYVAAFSLTGATSDSLLENRAALEAVIRSYSVQ